jgi:Domain of unknown function (DUF1929)/Bacterial Ig domain/RTX calcium-binding nonapeptide repeat (4 copies)
VRVTARLLVTGVIAAGAFCAPQSAFADPAVEGAWGPLQQYPVVPVSMGVMPDGKIVAWDQANRPPNFGSVPNNGPAMILDPQTGQITRTANIAPRTTFCSLIATLPDGRLAVIGGGSDSGAGAIADVQIYDAASRTFSVLGQMNQRRWYPGGTLDREGNPIVAGGTSAGIERFNQLTGVSTNLNTTFRTNWYPDLVRTPNGNFVIEDVGDNATAGPGRFLLSGTSLTTIADQTLLQARRRGVRTLIGPHTLFYNSGGTSRSSMILDASSGTPQYQLAAQSSFPHMTGQALTLPTGEVLVIGGNSTGSDTKGTPVMTPEIYSPSTNSWTSMANIERRRTYHSVAALLPDGRVWSAGSSFDEVQEPNGQFFSPPYLFRDDGSGQPAPRPTATGAPASVAAGQTFTVDTNTPNDIAYASFIRLAATTHQVNTGQAFVQLPVTAQSGRVEMRAPSVDQAPPGYYMVFLVNEDGTPSIAPVVRMYPSPTSTPQPRVVQVSQRDVASPAWNAFDGDAAQGSGAKISRTLDETQPWWEVDFGAPRDIENVRLRLPTTCCDAGNHDVWLIASSQPIQSTDLTTARNQPGVTAVRVQTPAGQYTSLATINRNAQYLRIQSTAPATSLALAEVELVANQKPTVQLTAPADGASFTAPAGYTISADAADADGNVTKVEFFRGATLVGTDDTAPFSVSDAGVAPGNYTLTAKATDNSGGTTTSAPHSITVTNQNAATVSKAGDITYQASAGAQNDVAISVASGAFRFVEPGIKAGAGCTQVASDRVDCSTSGGSEVTLNLGDQADTLNAASSSRGRLVVNAGDGDDTVSGGSKRNIIDGGAGDDVLAGGPVNDDFYGGTGADRFTGGAGLDRVFYADHGAGVTADIEPTGPASADDGNSTDGPAGSRDDITASIETISGSGFADVISAAAAQAAATLFGRAGNDVLTDGPFDDLLNGNGGADTFNCTGGGDDTIAGLQAIDTVNGSC